METDQSGGSSLAYLVHDVNDAAVRRRVDLFAGEGFAVGLAGFRRHAGPPGSVARTAGAGQVVDLGRTRDARLAQRAASVLRLLLAPARVRRVCAGAPVIVARNLEMLAIAARVRRPRQRLVYECLDVHRMMLGASGKSRVMRWIERWLLARTDLVIVSSPAFARDYFAAQQGRRDRVLLVENKVPVATLPGDAAISDMGARSRDRCTIGWFGMLRCRRSLDQLAALAAGSDGMIEVVIAGIPSPAEFPDFAAEVAARPGLRFVGPFAAADLPGLYGSVDYVWAIDYFEEGLNSAWLLPNRLYEGLAHGVVPIALRDVETGRWLAMRGVGVLVDDPLRELAARLASISATEREFMCAAIAGIPREALFQLPAERRSVARAVAGVAHAA